MKKWISMLLVFCLAMIPVPTTAVNADGMTAVTVSTPANIPAGGTFVARLNVTQVTNLNAFQLQLNFDPNVIQMAGPEGGPAGATSGLIGSTTIPIEYWGFYPAHTPGGAIRVLGRIPGNQQVSGSGYLADIHFNVLGSGGQSSALTPTGTSTFINGLFDANTIKITTVTPWSPASVHVVAPLQIGTTALAEAAVGEAYSQTLTASGGISPYSWNASGLPGGLNISGSGTISGTPTTSGNYSVQVNLSDSAVPVTTANTTLNLHINPALKITTTSLPDGEVGLSYSQNITVSGGISPYTWSVQSGSLPAGLLPSPAGAIAGVPTAAGGPTTFVLKVTDNLGVSANQSLSITIIAAPIINTGSPLPDGEVGLNYSQTLSANGGISPYTWSVQSGTLPGGLTLTAGGVIAGNPTTAVGLASFTVNVIDKLGGSTNKAFSVTVVGAPSITTASPLPVGEAGIGYSITLNATGGTGPCTWNATGLPSGLTMSTAGLISGTPSVPGDFSIVVTLTDSYGTPGSDTKTFSLHIFDAVQISSSALTEALQGRIYNQNLAAKGGNGPYVWSATGLPDGLTISTAGIISGSPTINGESDVTITLTDSLNGTNAKVKVLKLKVYMPYDANGNGVVDMGDVIKVERIILELDIITPAADIYGNGTVDLSVLDKIERVIVGLDQ